MNRKREYWYWNFLYTKWLLLCAELWREKERKKNDKENWPRERESIDVWNIYYIKPVSCLNLFAIIFRTLIWLLLIVFLTLDTFSVFLCYAIFRKYSRLIRKFEMIFQTKFSYQNSFICFYRLIPVTHRKFATTIDAKYWDGAHSTSYVPFLNDNICLAMTENLWIDSENMLNIQNEMKYLRQIDTIRK